MIQQLEEQLDNLNPDDLNLLVKKVLSHKNTKQKLLFNQTFPNVHLDKYSKINNIGGIIHYYKFNSQAHIYEFEMVYSKKKYSLKFYIDGNFEYESTKIPEKKIFINGHLNIKSYIDEIGDDINQSDINVDELSQIVNYLFVNNNQFIYNLD